MNAGAANVIVQGFLKGGFDVYDALLGLSFSYDTSNITDLAPDELPGLMDQYNVGMRAAFKGSGGAVAMLFSMEDVSKLTTLTETGEATVKDSLSDAEAATMREIAESCLGGGVANLSDKFGEDVELETVELVFAASEGVGELTTLLGDTITVSHFEFSAEPHFDSTSVLLFSQEFEKRVPDELVNAVFGSGEELAGEPLVSDDEMKDILSGFSPEPEATAAGAAAKTGVLPDNLGVILDIELVATARLGQVEMPISEVLGLGPGSMIEVGHLVDEPVELLINNKLIARGDVVVVDEKFGLRITEIISPEERIESLR